MGVVLIRSPAVQPFAWALAPTIVLRLFDGRGFNQVASRAAVRLGTCAHHRVLNVVVRVWVCDFRYRWKMTCSAKILLQCVTNLFDTGVQSFPWTEIGIISIAQESEPKFAISKRSPPAHSRPFSWSLAHLYLIDPFSS